ncbi:NUDIX hydrolase [Aerococcus viridans]|uniref:DNA mismatch repair protein MutT n=2 Tax=Aerococcus viridans TaxID=1377 RepID=A0AAU8U4U4_9LACT|nr:NUDIX domain-containing protein [Aerococcus viridans]AMC01003.1 DNA mismatch repair protein MutT [Aerococcus viridans]EFG49517.1 hydrolase, NUDIX family [Aerococcus viridans ATCC 11563 = CCUG 4311]
MASEKMRYTNPSAGILILTRKLDGQKQVLLQQRGQTEMLANKWDCISGHVEAQETVRQAMVREVYEELGVYIQADDLAFVGLTHLRLDDETTYYNIYLTTDRFVGTPQIMETDKHDDLKWVNLTDLPTMANEIVQNRYEAIQHLGQPPFYSEEGFT